MDKCLVAELVMRLLLSLLSAVALLVSAVLLRVILLKRGKPAVKPTGSISKPRRWYSKVWRQLRQRLSVILRHLRLRHLVVLMQGILVLAGVRLVDSILVERKFTGVRTEP